MTPEKMIQSKIIAYLSKLADEGHPIFYERRQAGGFSYKKGLPDIYVVYNGKHIEVEVKQPGGQLSPMQETWARLFKQLGIIHYVADDVEKFKQFMNEIMKLWIKLLKEKENDRFRKNYNRRFAYR